MNGRTELLVDLNGVGEVLVVADQRDYARWEVQPFRDETAVFLRVRFLAWSALFRQGTYTKPWEAFNEGDGLYVGAPDDAEESEGEKGLDPGPTTPTGGPA